MKKTFVILTLCAGLAFSGCGLRKPSGDPPSGGSDGAGTAAAGTEASTDGLGATGSADTGGGTEAGRISDAAGASEADAAGTGSADTGDGSQAGRIFGAPDASEAGAGTSTDGLGAPNSADTGDGGTRIAQGGPYGEISVTLPDGWTYTPIPIDSDPTFSTQYGLSFYPDGKEEGQIRLCYMDQFGVCGTGLSEEEGTIAGYPVRIGTYDNHAYWDFITFGGDCEGIVALTESPDVLWWREYGDTAAAILNTLSFDRDRREGGAYLYSSDSDVPEIGLTFSVRQITPSGAALVFSQYDPDLPSGELQYGDDFLLERKTDSGWEAVPVVIEGDSGFHAVAYVIPAGETHVQTLSWDWLYGELAPGTYRVKKTVCDFRGSGDFDRYPVSASFLLN